MRGIWITVSLSVVAAAVTLRGDAIANTNYYQPAVLCELVSGSSGTLEKDATIWNGSTTAVANVICPIAQYESSTQDPELFRLYYNETNTGSDLYDDHMICFPEMYTDTGTSYSGSWRYSCNTAGGCVAANSTDNPGNNYLAWTNPWNSTAGLVYIGIRCQLCESSPGTCSIRGNRMEVVGS